MNTLSERRRKERGRKRERGGREKDREETEKDRHMDEQKTGQTKRYANL